MISGSDSSALMSVSRFGSTQVRIAMIIARPAPNSSYEMSLRDGSSSSFLERVLREGPEIFQEDLWVLWESLRM